MCKHQCFKLVWLSLLLVILFFLFKNLTYQIESLCVCLYKNNSSLSLIRSVWLSKLIFRLCINLSLILNWPYKTIEHHIDWPWNVCCVRVTNVEQKESRNAIMNQQQSRMSWKNNREWVESGYFRFRNRTTNEKKESIWTKGQMHARLPSKMHTGHRK